MEIVYYMTCVGDAVMLCGIILYGVMICCFMLICICASHAGLLCLIGRDGAFWPGGSGLRTAWRNVFCRGRLASNDGRFVSLVNRVLAYQVT